MSDQPETLADICARIRTIDESMMRDLDFMAEFLEFLPRDIEAAAERERQDAMKTALLAKCKVCEKVGPASATGNAAVMREALEEQSRYWWSHIRNYSENEMLKRTDAALAAPARNCDVGTAEEQAERHGRFCAAHYKADTVDAQCFGCPASDKKETDCEFVWGQLPFAPAEGGAKCVNGLRGEPDCRGCNEHCEDVRKRNCFYWNPDIEGGVCALTGKKVVPDLVRQLPHFGEGETGGTRQGMNKADDLHAAFVKHCDACDPPGGCCHRKDTRGMLDTNCASILKCFARFAIANKDGDKK